jgi:hypothetical protein
LTGFTFYGQALSHCIAQYACDKSIQSIMNLVSSQRAFLFLATHAFKQNFQIYRLTIGWLILDQQKFDYLK